MFQMYYFNPRSHERSDFLLYAFCYILRNFNPRSHERSDYSPEAALLDIKRFQSTLPREERRLNQWTYKRLLHFNPRSHERSDVTKSGGNKYRGISIHAPTRGATLYEYLEYDYKYFNPRSHERSDKYTARKISMILNFNPRSHERSDHFPINADRGYNISIHAPTRGATGSIHKKNQLKAISIHAPTRGATKRT